jgi:hypothetical protein
MRHALRAECVSGMRLCIPAYQLGASRLIMQQTRNETLVASLSLSLSLSLTLCIPHVIHFQSDL